MRTYSVEDLAYWVSARPYRLQEGFGAEIVGWQGTIEGQLAAKVQEYEQAKNSNYADKIREYLKIWREHTFSGSINVETIEALLVGAEVLSVDDWKLNDYFRQIRDNLRRLKATAEELPAIPDEMAPEARGKPRLVTQHAPSTPSQDFGPEREAPGEVAPEEQAAAGEEKVGAQTGEENAELLRNKLEREESPGP